MNAPNPTDEQVAAFSRRVLASLPDSLAERKSDLAVLIKILPRKSSPLRAAMAMLAALQLSDQAQREFCFTESNFNGGK